MTVLWLRGLLGQRRPRLLAAATGIAIAVSLVAALGGFLTASKATMTTRAVSAIAVDWQVQVASSADPSAVLDQVRTAPGVRTALPVTSGAATALSTTTGGATQTTGAAVVLGLPQDYAQTFPDQLRVLTGDAGGAVLAQQTASNLRAQPGTTVTVTLPGGTSTTVVVTGVVELPRADSLFQTVGAPPGAQPVAPPDNVLLLPARAFDALYAPVLTADPAAVTTQVHVARDHGALPTDPAAAYVEVTGQARNLEVVLAGAGTVGDNLGASLDAARKDSLYSQVLFLFLGAPGAVLAGVLTATVTAAGGTRRRQEQALLRARGATRRQVLGLAGSEALVVGVLGAAIGLAVAWPLQALLLHSPVSLRWSAIAAAIGLGTAVVTVLVPTLRELRHATVAQGRATLGRRRAPLWQRFGVDVLALAGAFAIFRVTGRAGYTLVLAPEGVTSLSVSYWSFAGPALFWVGTGLLTWRLVDLLLGRGRRLTAVLLRPLTGTLAATVAAMLSRQRSTVARSVAVVALAGVFAVSVAVFNGTYTQQAEVDARLTNGADVTVTEPVTATAGPEVAAALAALPGVRSVEQVQHRFAYVGADLQDLYGVDPATIVDAALLQDAYFTGGTAAGLMAELAAQPDGILVSAETVTDYQLQPGDLLKLRVQDGATRALKEIPFHYLGIAKEFPTAPKDSFLVANAAYVARATANPAVGAYLLDTGGSGTAAVAAAASAVVGTSATVTDISAARGSVGSSLTSVDLAGLTRLELVYAVVLAAAGAGLVLALGFTERRRTFAVVTALGGTRRHTASVVLSEAAVVAVAGTVVAALAGWGLSQLLVTVLTGVFDPPPASLAVPWTYLLVVAATTLAVAAAVTVVAARASARTSIGVLREG